MRRLFRGLEGGNRLDQRRGIAGESRGKLVLVEFVFPTGDDDGRDRIADEVGERAAFRHEAVDAEDQRHAGDGISRFIADVASVLEEPALLLD